MSTTTRDRLLLALLAAVSFLPFLGGVHLFDWDEINFAEVSREMVVTGNWLGIQMDYFPFTEKPPFFFWLQAASMELFGVGEYAARFPNAVAGILVLPLLYSLGKNVRGRRFGLLWSLAYFGSILPNLYFRSGIIDPWFNLFIFLGLHFLWRFTSSASKDEGKTKWLLFAGVLTGLGILTKGPVAYLITGLVLFAIWVSKRFNWFIRPLPFIGYTLVALAVTGIWFGLETLLHGPDFIVEFTIRQWALFSTPDAGHGGFPGYHFVVLLLGCFPISVFALPTLFKKPDGDAGTVAYQKWMKVLLWVVLILFTVVKSKIIHYSSLAYYPLSFLAAWQIHNWIENKEEWHWANKLVLVVLALLVASVSLFIPYLGLHVSDFDFLFAQDPFAAANFSASPEWTGYEGLTGVVLLMATVASVFILYPINRPAAFYTLFGATAIWVFTTLIFYVKKIEGYTQRANIEFFEQLQGQEVYVATYKYKSYALYFYARTLPGGNPKRADENWLYHGPVDRDVYISCRIDRHKELEDNLMDEEFLYEKNGFYFYRRPAQIQ